MQWVATYKDGTVIKQHDKGNMTRVDDLDKSKIKRFRITEGTGDFALNLNVDSGSLKFSNLDYSKLQELNGGESFKFVFDKDTSSFKLDKESFDFIQDIVVKKESGYYYMEFNDEGIINVCGRTLRAGIIYNGQDIPLYGKQYNDFKVTVDVVSDLYCNMQSPVKQVQGNTAYNLFLNNTFGGDDLKIEVSFQVVYDLVRWQSYVKMLFKPNKTVNAKLYTLDNDGKREVTELPLVAGCISKYNKFMVMV